MKRRKLGRTGMEVSEIGIGCWGIGGPMRRDGTISGYGAVDDGESLRMLRGALDRGVNLFDTAPWYGDGHSERLVGKAIAGRRDQARSRARSGSICTRGATRATTRVISCAAGWGTRSSGWAPALLTSTSCILPRRSNSSPTAFRPSSDLKAAGVIRAVGISLPASIEESLRFYLPLLRQWPVDVVQVPYNLLKFQAGEQLLPELAALGIGVICREPFYFGYLTGRFDQNTQSPRATSARPGRASAIWTWCGARAGLISSPTG